MSSQLFEESYETSSTIHDNESGYASGASSQDGLPDIYFSKPHLKFLNQQLQKLEPQGEYHNPAFRPFLCFFD
jgi:phosphoadenosine phosphosulfate reductase